VGRTWKPLTNERSSFHPGTSIEATAQQQILNTAAMPFVFKHIAVVEVPR
jgi:hypothetical protein